MFLIQRWSSGSSSGIPGLSSGDSSSSTSLLTGRLNTDPVADWTVTYITLVISTCSNNPSRGPLVSASVVIVQKNDINFSVVSSLTCPLLSRLKALQIFFAPSAPELVCNMLYTPPASLAIKIFSLKLPWSRKNKLGLAGEKCTWR